MFLSKISSAFFSASLTNFVIFSSIKADMRSLNYDEFFTKGAKRIAHIEDYNSNSAKNLTIEETIRILKKLDFVNEALKIWQKLWLFLVQGLKL